MENKDAKKPLPCRCGSKNISVTVHGIGCRECGNWMGDGTLVREKFGTVLDGWNFIMRGDDGEKETGNAEK